MNRGVVKFGGSILADAQAYRRGAAWVNQYGKATLLVVSAARGMTDLLLAATGRGAEEWTRFESFQRDLFRDLGVHELPELAQQSMAQVAKLLRQPRAGHVDHALPQAADLDLIMGLGEILSWTAMQAALDELKCPFVARLPEELGLLTDSEFGAARPRPDALMNARRHLQALASEPLILTAGFVAKDLQGHRTSMGRNSSDGTAAFFAAALATPKLRLYGDTPGVMRADPKILPGAELIPSLSYAEAIELGRRGARVLHPWALELAREHNIAVGVSDLKERSWTWIGRET